MIYVDKSRPTLIIMAAGMGSRFGGLKQLTPVGPSGKMIIDYSIHDAIQAGFGKIVFVIKRAIEADFKEAIVNRTAEKIPVEYVYQELDKLPEGYTVPEGRAKPWGTGHAVLCCRGIVNEPFMVINADDFYGPKCFRMLAEFLSRPQDGEKLHIAMAAYILENTLTENGYVSRGIATVDGDGKLVGLVERIRIEIRENGAAYSEDDGKTWILLPPGCPVSMNCWAFPEGALDKFEDKFRRFLDDGTKDSPKAEFYLPFAVDAMVEAGEADVTVLHTDDKWYGMTYAEDKRMVTDAIRKMTEEGLYPKN